MAVFFIYSLADLGVFDASFILTGGPATVQGTATPDLVQVSDDDGNLDTLSPPSSGGVPVDLDQVLAADLSIDGSPAGTTGDSINILGDAAVFNYTSFESGTFSAIIVNGNLVGFASTIELSPGDQLSVSPANILTPSPQPYDDLFSCFTQDTKILCEYGEVPVQALQVGDLVVTKNHSLQPIRWIGSKKISGLKAMAPVRIKAGALGNTSDILVSPMHRMLIDGPRAELLFGEPELLAHAKDLRDGDKVFVEPQDSVEYFHILFDDHQIISAHGCWSESFAPRHDALDAFEDKTRDEVLKLFPHLEADWQDALPTLTAHEAALFAAK